MSEVYADFIVGTIVDDFGEDLTADEHEALMVAKLPELMRARACPAGEPWTGDRPDEYHGHTDCWYYHLAAKEIERLRAVADAVQEYFLYYTDDHRLAVEAALKELS